MYTNTITSKMLDKKLTIDMMSLDFLIFELYLQVMLLSVNSMLEFISSVLNLIKAVMMNSNLSVLSCTFLNTYKLIKIKYPSINP